MADTFTSSLKIRQPQTGQYANTWGAIVNSDALELLDTAIAGVYAFNLTAATYSLPAMANGADSGSRYFCLQFTGAPSNPVLITVPSSVTAKFYLIDNESGQPLTFTYAASTETVTVPVAEKRLIWCDGTNCFDVQTSPPDLSAYATTVVVNAGVAALNAAIALKANINAPTFTGVPAAPTAADGTSTTQLATTAFVQAAVGLAALTSTQAVNGKVTLPGGLMLQWGEVNGVDGTGEVEGHVSSLPFTFPNNVFFVIAIANGGTPVFIQSSSTSTFTWGTGYSGGGTTNALYVFAIGN